MEVEHATEGKVAAVEVLNEANAKKTGQGHISSRRSVRVESSRE
jgi:hypothetical protein